MRNNAALIERVLEGDKQAENEMVEQNMGLVYSIVKRFSGRGCDTEDLTQIGAIGLIKAVKKFNPAFNVQFSTYAVKISRALKESAMKGWRAEEQLRRRLGREPTLSEISAECGISADELSEAFEAAAPPGSLYESVYDNGEKEIRLVDTLAGESIEDGVINKVMLDNILAFLKPREKQVLVLRYFKGKTQTEIAEIMGVSQVQISRIEKNAIKKIREMNM